MDILEMEEFLEGVTEMLNKGPLEDKDIKLKCRGSWADYPTSGDQSRYNFEIYLDSPVKDPQVIYRSSYIVSKIEVDRAILPIIEYTAERSTHKKALLEVFSLGIDKILKESKEWELS